jgi:two-component system, NarL family, response regulator NreC
MRILLADDNEFVRRGIAGILAQEEDLVLCGEASNSQEAIEKTSELHPDLVLLDVSMPDGNGLETTPVLKQKSPQTTILIITQHDPRQMLPRSLEVGASGCVDKARLAIDLLPAIRALQNVSFSRTVD